jgi:general secretion pathway protein C
MRMRKNWVIRLATFALWLLAVGGGVVWALKFVQGTATPANAAIVTAPVVANVDSQALARGLGGGLGASAAATTAVTPVPEPTGGIVAARFVLSGVIEGGSARQSLALIAVDGKPARPYRVGAQLADGVVLQSVLRRQVSLAGTTGKAGAVTLDLPRPYALPATITYTPPPQPVVVAPQVVSPVVVPDQGNAVPPGPGAIPGRLGGPNSPRARALRDAAAAAREAAGEQILAPAGASTQ